MIIGRRWARSQSSCETDVAHGVLDDGLVGGTLSGGLGERPHDQRLSIGQKRVSLGAEGEAPGDQLRLADRPPGLTVDDHDDGGDAVLGQQLPVAQDHVAHVAHAEPVDVDHAVLDALGDAGTLVVDLETVAVVEHEDVLAGYAHLFGQAGVRGEVTRLAVDGHEELRLHEVEHELELLGGRVTRDVHVHVAPCGRRWRRPWPAG